MCLLASCAELTAAEIRAESPVRLRVYLDDDRSWVREEAARALGGSKDAAAARDLERVLVDEREKRWVRAAAAEALGRIADPGSFEAIAAVASSAGTAPEIDLAVIEALCAYRDREDAMRLLGALTKDPDLLVASLAEKKARTRCAR
jgi:HEAT repeat protein